MTFIMQRAVASLNRFVSLTNKAGFSVNLSDGQ